MSNIALTPNASGAGTFTIASPNSGTSRTLTLPDTTGVLLNDASALASSKLTGALPAIDGSALTGVGGSTTAGDVGTYAFLSEQGNGQPDRDFGDTLAGSSLTLASASTYSTFIWNNTNIAVSGTWRLMGDYPSAIYQRNNTTAVWVRIS